MMEVRGKSCSPDIRREAITHYPDCIFVIPSQLIHCRMESIQDSIANQNQQWRDINHAPQRSIQLDFAALPVLVSFCSLQKISLTTRVPVVSMELPASSIGERHSASTGTVLQAETVKTICQDCQNHLSRPKFSAIRSLVKTVKTIWPCLVSNEMRLSLRDPAQSESISQWILTLNSCDKEQDNHPPLSEHCICQEDLNKIARVLLEICHANCLTKDPLTYWLFHGRDS